MIQGNLAKRYARALLELADSPMKRDRFEKDLNALAETSEVLDETGTPLALTLDAGRYPLSQRRALGAAICKRLMTDATVTKFLDLVVERGRASGLRQIAAQYAELADAQAGRVRATVTSATPLAPGATAQVKTALESATGKKVL
ncbi:MAG: F0F1 ATP synthase subunit delta, partial [Nannocystaceae bacterium]